MRSVFAGSLLLAIVTAAAGLARAQEASPPPATLLLQDIRIHDPWILAHAASKTYYLYTSSRDPETRRSGVKAYQSRDLKHWTGPREVFQVPDGIWANPTHGTWASEVHAYRGRYYLFVTLHNNDAVFAKPPEVWRPNHLRGTAVAVADSPDGPFELIKRDGPHPPREFMTLDGTLHIDPDGQPWMVYCHEWIQKIDGTISAIRLTDDLAATSGEPLHLFKGSDAPWLNASLKPDASQLSYVTDGCQLYRTREGSLVMLWSSYRNGVYIETQARSKSGKLAGPWEQLDPLVDGDSGHGMFFDTFDGQRMLVVHRPFGKPTTRAKLYDVEDAGDRFRIVRPRGDLDGDGRAAISEGP
jgi:beta-xylosidase